jgi:hypothetical protein
MNDAVYSNSAEQAREIETHAIKRTGWRVGRVRRGKEGKGKCGVAAVYA